MGIATGDGSQQLALGMIVPAVDLPIPIGGILELEGGVVWRHLFSGESRGSFAVLYEQNYKSLITWYAKPFDYVARRWELEGSVEPTEFSFGFGASIMPFFTFPDKPVLGLLSQRARIRAGVRFDIVHATPRLGRFEVQFVMYPR